ncbi:hypothetical protein [Sphingosinithalassobacter sp. CS137]|uniref:hypothetical protein n=1 Tax=Sphingosinithalassobacter sp. CS137 TaxID=2762748 RepID=UPI00165D89BF|nr:hypothetical protein [Sphingosinithalassobacter sp. CS137]
MFEAKPTARADMTAGTLYAVTGEAGWTYYGQITPEKMVGFFRRRDLEPSAPSDVLAAKIMSVISVAYPSITRALRTGRWKKLGGFPVVEELVAPRPSVQWPVGTLTVTVWVGDRVAYDTRVEDSAIQSMELMAVWDAGEHIPARLTADFGAEEAEWHVGGPIWRERRIKEEMAARFTDQPWNRLPEDWVPTEVRS